MLPDAEMYDVEGWMADGVEAGRDSPPFVVSGYGNTDGEPDLFVENAWGIARPSYARFVEHIV